MIAQERRFTIGKQTVTLESLPDYGRILDIGGGGEGIIGQLMGERVVAIDPMPSELIEAAEGPLKIIMDARELKFLDNTFDMATAFFTFMFIANQDHETVLREIHRVLKSGGELIIWDAVIPEYPGGVQDVFIIPLEVNLKGRSVNTGYGCLWPDKVQNLEYFIELAGRVGFHPVGREHNGETFCLRVVK